MFEIGPIRPPNEGGDRSLLIRATRNCPWNRCLFCRTYQGQRFVYRPVAEIIADIDAARAIADELRDASRRMGMGGRITNQVLAAVMRGSRGASGSGDAGGDSPELRLHAVYNVADWLASGARTVFLQDGDTPIMRTADLVEVLRYLRATFPSVERITSYARSKTLARKSIEDLRRLREAGLTRLHVGLESGSDRVLAYMQKGVTAEEHIAAGRKAIEAGIDLSVYVMPGLGGREWSYENALETARVLNAIRPHFVRLRTLVPRNGSPLQERVASGEFPMLSEDGVVEEIRLLIESLNVDAYLSSDQMCNLLSEIEGRLPERKAAILGVVAEYQALSLPERLELQLERRLRSYYAVFGGLGPEAEAAVRRASEALQARSPNAEAAVEAALLILKRQFI